MATKSVDRQTFLARVIQSGLVSADQLVSLQGSLPSSARGRVVARALVEMGLLTRFQAERILGGRTSGFQLGQYRILEELGRGGMGKVYKAEHRTMGRLVALKVLSPPLLRTERAQELFLREMRAAAQLAHPNIVTAYDANHLDGHYFLVMEYVDGPNLEQLVRAQGPLSVGLACDAIRQAAMGLQCAHLMGMVHRDIKPANILVQRRGLREDSPGLVKISDFGLARLHAPGDSPRHGPPAGTIIAKENTVMGTPDYLSPEQARSVHRVDIRGDIYSLGCTFYYLLTGQPPFPGGTALEKLIRHTTEQPAPVSSFRGDVPAPVLGIVERMMARHPEDRFQTPAEVVNALAPFAVSGAIPWAPPPEAAPLLEIEQAEVEPEGSSDSLIGPGSTPAPEGSLSSLASLLTPAQSSSQLGSLVLYALGIATLLALVLGIVGLLAGAH